jgi:hypothetical protein
MTERFTAIGRLTARDVLGRPSLRRLGWLVMVALPAILAACGKGGTSGY